jgi:hypothetical protein
MTRFERMPLCLFEKYATIRRHGRDKHGHDVEDVVSQSSAAVFERDKYQARIFFAVGVSGTTIR